MLLWSADSPVCRIIAVVDFIDRNENSEQRVKQNTLLSYCKNTANTCKSTISQGNKSPSKHQTNRRKRKWQFQSKIDKIKIMTHATNYINFSTIKKMAMLEKDTAPNWDRMWSLNRQWQITCSSVCITPQGHSLSSLGIYDSIYPSLWPTYVCDEYLIRVAYTRSRSGIPSTFPIHT